MSAPTTAVFLSYAREDTAAAQRIAESLRSHGVEVWFDQSELRGGDTWDANIKRQIRDCALFLPVISASTQARREGYFRREWKLAVERTHDMADGTLFLLPVVIDDTKDRDALVPEVFLKVQWSRLPGGETSAAFAQRVRSLLGAGPEIKAGHSAGAAASPSRQQSDVMDRRTPGRPQWAWGVVAVIVLGAAGFFITRKSTPPGPQAESSFAKAAGDKSIAVLPFENMSDDKDTNAFFADGIHEDILTNLSNIRELRVVSRTSVMQYRATTKPIPQIARELGVAYILEGSVRRAGGKVRVTGQLIRAATDEHVWAQSYDRELTDIFGIQAELAKGIAGELRTALTPEEQKLVEHRPTASIAAYDLFLKARDLNNREGNRNPTLREQDRLLQEAVTLDPNFADAWGLLAWVHSYSYLINLDHTDDRLAKAKAAIETAQRLAPNSPEVILNLGYYYYFGYRDYARAVVEFQKVQRLQPNSAKVPFALGLIQRRQAKWAEAMASFREAVRLAPGDFDFRRQVAIMAQAGRRYAEARAERERLPGLVPEEKLDQAWMVAWLWFLERGSTREIETFLAGVPPAERKPAWLGALATIRNDYAEVTRLHRLETDVGPNGALAAAVTLAAQGDRVAARVLLEKFPAELQAQLKLEPANATQWALLGRIEAILGHREEALRCVRQAMALVPESIDAWDGPKFRSDLAFVYAWTGDKDRAVREYGELLQTVSPSPNDVHWMKHDTAYAPLRGYPPFEALLNDPKNNQPLF